VLIKPAPDHKERTREFLGTPLGPGLDLFAVKPTPSFDFLWVQWKGSLRDAAEHFGEFLVCLGSGRKFEQKLRWTIQPQPDLFPQFPDDCLAIILARVEVPGSGGIPKTRLPILRHRALLKEKLSTAIEDKGVRGAVKQAKPVHIGAAALSDDLITFVHHVEQFFT
jgi:hypothetical protein